MDCPKGIPSGKILALINLINEKMAFIYFLKSEAVKNWHYIGSCEFLEERLRQHKKGSVKSTKSKRPLALIYSEYYLTVALAKKREYFLKSPKGYLEKRRIINGCLKK